MGENLLSNVVKGEIRKLFYFDIPFSGAMIEKFSGFYHNYLEFGYCDFLLCLNMSVWILMCLKMLPQWNISHTLTKVQVWV